MISTILLAGAGSVVMPALAQDSSAALPEWLAFSLEWRGRTEGYTGLEHDAGRNDAYSLNRVRFDVSFLPADWLGVGVEVQDSRAAWRREPVPAGVENPLDIHHAFVEAGRLKGDGWSLRAGRQELAYGDERLVGPSNWGNVGRVFDAARLSWKRNRTRLDWFAATLVKSDEDHLDRFESNPKLFGVYGSFSRRRKGPAIEPYLFWKHQPDERSERGRTGAKDVYTAGVRVTGPLPSRFDYTLETAFQAGRQAGDPIGAWAGSYTVGRAVRGGVRVYAEYDHASGDDRPDNGRQGTFDQLYPTNHSKYGIGDRMGWRNMRGIRAGSLFRLRRNWSVQGDYHSFWLASKNDFLYRGNGRPVVRNPEATSAHTHQELDLRTVINVRKWLDLFGGYAHVFPGRFLKESTGGSPMTFAYVMFRVKL